MHTPTQISVILCTYNRAKSVAKTLESIVIQSLPQSVRWEIVVIDNNSRDETAKVVEEFRRRYPDLIRYAVEPQQGISNARNAGIRMAQGDILAFIDDDETADTAWLKNLTANLRGEQWAGAGGRVVPEWNSPPPRWWSSNSAFLVGPLAVFDADDRHEELSNPPFGANMAFRRHMFGKYGGFRTDLGRSGENLLGNEDTEFGRRLLAAGERLRYEPSAVTYHPVEPFRLRRGYFLQWWFNKGRSDVLETGIRPGAKYILGFPLRLFRDAGVEVLHWVFAKQPSQRFVCHLKVWAYAGQAVESYFQTRESRRKRQGPGAQSRGMAENAN